MSHRRSCPALSEPGVRAHNRISVNKPASSMAGAESRALVNVLLIGHTDDCLDYLGYARERGFGVQFFDAPSLAAVDRSHWQRAVVDSAREVVNLSAVDEVISFHDGYQAHTELLRAELGLPTRSIDALLCLADKRSFKAHPALGDYITRHVEFSPSMTATEAFPVVDALGFPLVLKPSNGFYSAGVVKVDGPEDFTKAFLQTKRVCGLLREGTGASTILAEKYLDGGEYAVDGVVTCGRVLPLQLHHKLPPLVGPLFHEVAYLTEPFDRDKGREFTRALRTIIPAIGLDESPFHAEFRFDAEGKLHILEVAPRLSGGGATTYQLLRICTGLDAYGMLHQLGREPIDPKPTHHRVGLEFDAPVPRSGFLRNIARAVEVCTNNDATTVLELRRDGQFVLAPPLNFEAVLTAFFARDTREQAEALLEILLTDCVIETEMERKP